MNIIDKFKETIMGMGPWWWVVFVWILIPISAITDNPTICFVVIIVQLIMLMMLIVAEILRSKKKECFDYHME